LLYQYSKGIMSMPKDFITSEQLQSHLETKCMLNVLGVSKLDVSVYRVDCSGKCYVARVFPSRDSYTVMAAIAHILKQLELDQYPAERVLSNAPVTEFTEPSGPGCVLLTYFVSGKPPERNRYTFGRLGALLGRLHSLPIPEGALKGGAWHHLLLTGGLIEECDSAIQMLESTTNNNISEVDLPGIEQLCEELRGLRATFLHAEANLPKALVHPDFVPANIVAEKSNQEEDKDKWTVVDWAGTGVGSRVYSLGFLLGVGAIRGKMILVHAIMKGYGRTIKLEKTELDILPQASYVRFFTIQCWEVSVGRKSPSQVLQDLPNLRNMGMEVAKTVQEIYSATS
jgi:Ser/Thr protein kinase RdoA (MazF antagonist)